MIIMIRILLGVALATGCISGAQRVDGWRPVAVQGHAVVHIKADDASVRVSTADVAQVEMQVTSEGYDPEDLHVSMTPRGGVVEIVAKTRDRWHWFNITRHRVHLEVRVPWDADVAVSSGDGSVEVDAIAGNLDVRTGDGNVVVRGARGSIRLHTGDGSIDGRDLDGAIDATSGDGSVRLAGRFDALAVNTGDGRLTASVLPGSRVLQPWHLETGDGSVELGLPRDLAAHIDARTGDGHVRSAIPLQQLGDSRFGGDIHGGGPPIVVRTGDGSIRLSEL